MTKIARTAAAPVAEQIHVAQRLARRDRARGLAALNDLFRAGAPPALALDGRYAGELVALDIAPGLTQAGALLAAAWMPWKGKTFDAQRSSGDNIFSRDSLALTRICWPLYRGYVDDGPRTYRAFTFRTYMGPGRADPDRRVLKIDYDLPTNPRLSIRRVLDELVQVADGLYLGKAYMTWWWGRSQLVAYFMLSHG